MPENKSTQERLLPSPPPPPTDFSHLRPIPDIGKSPFRFPTNAQSELLKELTQRHDLTAWAKIRQFIRFCQAGLNGEPLEPRALIEPVRKLIGKSTSQATRYLDVALAEPCLAEAVDMGVIRLSVAATLSKHGVEIQQEIVQRVRGGQTPKEAIKSSIPTSAKVEVKELTRQEIFIAAAKKWAKLSGHRFVANNDLEELAYLASECKNALERLEEIHRGIRAFAKELGTPPRPIRSRKWKPPTC